MAERVGKAKKTAAKAKGATRRGQPPGKGHNSSATHAVPDEVYARHLDKIERTGRAMERAKEAYDQAKSAHQNAYKQAGEDGCDKDAIRLARKLDKQDHGIIHTTYSNVARVLNLMGSKLGSEQLGLFDNLPGALPVPTALEMGERAGRAGDPMSGGGHKPGTEAFAQWEEGWRIGQQTLQAGIGKSPVH